MSVVKSTRARTVLLIIAAGILIIALVWKIALSGSDVLTPVSDELARHGYTVGTDDIFVAGEKKDTSVRALLSDVDMSSAVDASIHAGFPSDPDKVGDVVLLLVRLESDDVITIYLVDTEIELCFVQSTAGKVRSLDE